MTIPLAVAAALVACMATPALAEDSSPRAGMRAYTDPAAKGEPAPTDGGTTTSSKGLVERPVTSPPGGVAVDMQGRFKNAAKGEAKSPDGGK
jgi:hypothetical protein